MPIHIRQKGSSDNLTYTVVNTTGWVLPLEQHPSIVEHPDLFEIVNVDIPEDAQILDYQSSL
jgi:hypothetical protein